MPSGFSHRNLKGVFIPFVTPFDADGGLDLDSLRSNIEHWSLSSELSGFVALGSSGERVSLDERECRQVVEASRNAVTNPQFLIAGAGRQSTIATIREVRLFAEIGVDAVLVISPSFYGQATTQSAQSEFFLRVADASPVPVILYNIPQLTHVSISPETVARLAEHENIVGIKDSSGNLLNLMDMIRMVPEPFSVLTGSGPIFYAALSAGADGGILAVSAVALDTVLEIDWAVAGEDHNKAKELQERLTPLAKAVVLLYGIGGLKAAMELIGLKAGPVRSPLVRPDESSRREIEQYLRAVSPVAGNSMAAAYGRNAKE